MKIFKLSYSNSFSHLIKSPPHNIIPASLLTLVIVSSMQAIIATATILLILPIIRFLIVFLFSSCVFFEQIISVRPLSYTIIFQKRITNLENNKFPFVYIFLHLLRQQRQQIFHRVNLIHRSSQLCRMRNSCCIPSDMLSHLRDGYLLPLVLA